MKCKKHGEVPETITFSVQVQPVYPNRPDLHPEPYETGPAFCMRCLNEFLAKNIGTCES